MRSESFSGRLAAVDMLKSIKAGLIRLFRGKVARKATSLEMGRFTRLHPTVEIHAGHVTIGDYTYISENGRISSLPETKIRIGKFTSIASGVQIIGALHKSHITNYSLTKLYPGKKGIVAKHGISRGDIVIGNDVWIGVNVVVLSGVSIGDGAVIGAGAVVTKDVPPYSIVAGVPAVVKKMRFSEDDIKRLLSARWWDWDMSKIERNLHLFYDDNVSIREFLECADDEKTDVELQ